MLVLLVAGGCGAGVFLWRGLGPWGWVTLQQLQDKLVALRGSLIKAVESTQNSVTSLQVSVDELREGVQAQRATLAMLEGKLTHVEQHSKRSAEGIELLLQLVGPALAGTANAEALAKLREFAPAAFPELPSPTASAVSGGLLEHRPVAPMMPYGHATGSSSSLMRAMLTPLVAP